MQTHNKSNGYVAVAMLVFMVPFAAAAEEPAASQIVDGQREMNLP
jgi:hypothetical protein